MTEKSSISLEKISRRKAPRNDKLDEFVKCRHSGESRIESGTGAGIQNKYNYWKELDSGSGLPRT